MYHKVTFLSKSIILSVHLSYEFQFPDSAFEGIFKTSFGSGSEKSEMGWLFCENIFPTDNWVFLSSVNCLQQPPSSVEWLIFGRVSSALDRRKQIQDAQTIMFWCEKQLLRESPSCWWHWQIWGLGGLLHDAAFWPSRLLFLMSGLTSCKGVAWPPRKAVVGKVNLWLSNCLLISPLPPFQDVLWWIEARNHWGLHFVFCYVCTLPKLPNTSPCWG